MSLWIYYLAFWTDVKLIVFFPGAVYIFLFFPPEVTTSCWSCDLWLKMSVSIAVLLNKTILMRPEKHLILAPKPFDEKMSFFPKWCVSMKLIYFQMSNCAIAWRIAWTILTTDCFYLLIFLWFQLCLNWKHDNINKFLHTHFVNIPLMSEKQFCSCVDSIK